jgi:uncharacterized protein
MAPSDASRYGLLGVTGYHDNCRDNLNTALQELGITVPATPPSLNLFMNIPWMADGRLSWGEPASTPGSYAVFRAEMDLVIAFSACPQDILPINGRTGRTTEAHFAIEYPDGVRLPTLRRRTVQSLASRFRSVSITTSGS